jgi:hypothetical protein
MLRLLVAAGFVVLPFSLGTTLLAGAGSDAGTPDLTLASDADGTALVSATSLAPGHPVTRCLRLSYGNAVPDDRIRLMTSPTGGLADHLTVRVEAGTGGGAGTCTGFSGSVVYSGSLADLGRRHGTAQAALPVRTLTGGNGQMSVRLRFALDGDNAAQGQSATADLVWIADATGNRTAPPPVVTPVNPPPVVPPATAPPVVRPPNVAPPATLPPVTVPPATVPPATSASVPVPPVAVPTEPPTSVTSIPATPPTTDPNSSAPGPPTSPAPASPAPPASTTTDGGGPPSPAPPTSSGVASTAVAAVGHALGSGAKAVASAADSAAHAVNSRVIAPVAGAAAPAARGAGYGLGGTAPLLGAFLLIQGRIDRRDPKLALAPSYADPDLTFNDIPRGPLTFRAPTDPALDPEPGETS